MAQALHDWQPHHRTQVAIANYIGLNDSCQCNHAFREHNGHHCSLTYMNELVSISTSILSIALIVCSGKISYAIGRKVLHESQGPEGGADLRFLSPQPDTSLLCETADTRLMHRTCIRSIFCWYSLPLSTEGWPGCVDLGGWLVICRNGLPVCRRSPLHQKPWHKIEKKDNLCVHAAAVLHL